MIVRKHMSAPPITVSHDADFKTAMGLMQEHRIRRLPVLGPQGALVGIVAERDLLVAAGRYLASPVDVAQIMTRRVVTVGDATPVIDAATVMIERKIGGLPVIDGAGRLLGIITETDLFKALATLLKRGESRLARAPSATRAKAHDAKRKRSSSAATRPSAGKAKPKTRRRI